MGGRRFGERPEFGAPGSRTSGERRAFTANYELTEFSLAVTTHHLDEVLEVEVSLLGDQPQTGFVAFPIYRELHPQPDPGRSAEPSHVLGLEAAVVATVAGRLERLLMHG